MKFAKIIQTVVMCIATTVFISSCGLPEEAKSELLGERPVTVLSKVSETTYKVLTKNGDTILGKTNRLVNDITHFRIGNIVILDNMERLMPTVDIRENQQVFITREVPDSKFYEVVLTTGDTLYVRPDVGLEKDRFQFKMQSHVNMRFNTITNVIYPNR